jgi:hypothetical protein
VTVIEIPKLLPVVPRNHIRWIIVTDAIGSSLGIFIV